MIARLLLTMSLLLATAAASAAPETLRFYGYAYDLKTNRYLYTEAHEQRVDGDHWLGGTIRYYSPDAKLIGVKELSFASDPYVPVYKLDILADGYMEAITAVGKDIVLQKRSKRGEPLQEKTLAHPAMSCGDSGFHSFLRANFQSLMAGKTVSFTLVVAGNLDAYQFRAKRIGDTQFEGKTAVRFRVEPDSMLRYFVDPLEVTYDPSAQRLLEYRGLANIPNPADGKPFVARIAFYSQPPKDLPKLPPATQP